MFIDLGEQCPNAFVALFASGVYVPLLGQPSSSGDLGQTGLHHSLKY